MALKIKLRQSGNAEADAPLYYSLATGLSSRHLEMATGTVLTIWDAFSGFYVDTGTGCLGICQRDGGISVTDADGKELWSSVHGVPAQDEPSPFQKYARIVKLAEMRPYIEGEPMAGISVSPSDAQEYSPKVGDMIARDPDNHDDQWLIYSRYFAENFLPDPL